jgi:hypothetical protein
MSMVLEHEAEETTRAITAALARRGLSAVRSFDLRSALAQHTNCDCPHHGTADCGCQFVVLLVYQQQQSQSRADGHAEPPVVLTCHCQDSRTEVQVVQDANAAPDPELAEQVSLALLAAALALHTAPGVLVEASPDGR